MKQDEIGGKKFNELAYEWESLNIGDYNWAPLSVDEVKKVFKSFKPQWWIAGGWAIDLFLKKQTRPHDDIDVLIRREDQIEVQNLLDGWDLWAADPPGTLKPWGKGEYLKKVYKIFGDVKLRKIHGIFKLCYLILIITIGFLKEMSRLEKVYHLSL
jgi:hypothetical protein